MRKLPYLLLIVLLCSHDLYLKMEQYFLEPNQEATMSLYNGTFEKSENVITRDRMLDASIVAQGKRRAIASEQWKDQDSTITHMTFNTEWGTYVAGVSTKARNIELNAESFNNYLEHDGVLDMLEERKKDGALNQDAVESYEKHVKAIFQVGKVLTNDWDTVLGYPIEFVPQANPYGKYSGDALEVQLLLNGEPLPNQLVYANFLKNHQDRGHDDGEHHHDHPHEDDQHGHSHSKEEEESHTHTDGQQLRTNEQGMITVDLPEDGTYYLRTIYMTEATDTDTLTHRSKWATLTFGVRHKHGPDTHTHDHAHEHGDEFPTWPFVLGSMLIIGVLFLYFRKKDAD